MTLNDNDYLLLAALGNIEREYDVISSKLIPTFYKDIYNHTVGENRKSLLKILVATNETLKAWHLAIESIAYTSEIFLDPSYAKIIRTVSSYDLSQMAGDVIVGMYKAQYKVPDVLSTNLAILVRILSALDPVHFTGTREDVAKNGAYRHFVEQGASKINEIKLAEIGESAQKLDEFHDKFNIVIDPTQSFDNFDTSSRDSGYSSFNLRPLFHASGRSSSADTPDTGDESDAYVVQNYAYHPDDDTTTDESEDSEDDEETLHEAEVYQEHDQPEPTPPASLEPIVENDEAELLSRAVE